MRSVSAHRRCPAVTSPRGHSTRQTASTPHQPVRLDIETHHRIHHHDIRTHRHRVTRDIGHIHMSIITGVVNRWRVTVRRESMIAVIAEHIILGAITRTINAAEIHDAIGLDYLQNEEQRSDPQR